MKPVTGAMVLSSYMVVGRIEESLVSFLLVAAYPHAIRLPPNDDLVFGGSILIVCPHTHECLSFGHGYSKAGSLQLSRHFTQSLIVFQILYLRLYHYRTKESVLGHDLVHELDVLNDMILGVL